MKDEIINKWRQEARKIDYHKDWNPNNITRDLTKIALEYDLNLESVIDKYQQFYSECTPEHLDHPINLMYDSTILKMTRRYYEIMKK